MNPCVLMPTWGSDPVRLENEAYVERHYSERYGWPVFKGRGVARAHSINDAARQAWGKHDVFILADNDLIPDPVRLLEALALVGGYAAVTPHRYTLLTTPETRQRYMRAPERWPNGESVRTGSRSYVVISAEVFDRVNGMDERFIGWGPEDKAFLASVSKQAGEVRELCGVRLHLWHDTDPSRFDRVSLTRNRLRFKRYRTATTERAALMAREYGVWREDEPVEQPSGASEHAGLTQRA